MAGLGRVRRNSKVMVGRPGESTGKLKDFIGWRRGLLGLNMHST